MALDCGRLCCLADESKEVVINAKPQNPGIGTTQDFSEPPVDTSKEADCPDLPVDPRASGPDPELGEKKVDEPIAEQFVNPNVARLDVPKKRELNIVIKKVAGQDLGLDVDYGDKTTLKVMKVKPGLVNEWNIAKPDLEVRIGDRIVSVNGVGGTTDRIIGEVTTSSTLDLKVRRDDEIEISIVKESEDQPTGLDIDGLIVKVLKVKEGPVNDYNNKLEDKFYEVKTGDKIIGANGQTGVQNVIKELKSARILNLIISRSMS